MKGGGSQGVFTVEGLSSEPSDARLDRAAHESCPCLIADAAGTL
jgi:hypothetical protein